MLQENSHDKEILGRTPFLKVSRKTTKIRATEPISLNFLISEILFVTQDPLYAFQSYLLLSLSLPPPPPLSLYLT